MTQSQLCFHISAGWYQVPRHQLHPLVFECSEGIALSLAGNDHWQHNVCPDLTYSAPANQRKFISLSI